MSKLSLSYPITPVIYNQKFGKPSDFYGSVGLQGHNGIDFGTRHGQPVYASHDGLASFQIDSGGGHGVVVITEEKFEFEGTECQFKSIYWHLCDGLKEPRYQSPIADKTGFIKVRRGELLGYADNTGASTGDHLHFGLKPVAPGEDGWSWTNVAQNNGYLGAIDPLPYFTDIQQLHAQLEIAQIKLVDLLKLKVKYLLEQLHK